MNPGPETYDGLVMMGRDLVGAGFLGRAHDVLRVRASTPITGVLDDAPVRVIDARLDRSRKKEIEGQVFDVLAFDIKGDTTALSLGDILRLRATEYQADGMVACFAQREPMAGSIAMRCEGRVKVYRPVDVNNRVDDPVPDDWSFKKGTIAQDTTATRDVLTLLAGTYSWKPAGSTAVVVPFGAQPTSRARPGRFTGVPSDTPVERFVGYIPPCKGVNFRDNDVFEYQDATGIAYAAEQVYASNVTGVFGTVLLLSKEGV